MIDPALALGIGLAVVAGMALLVWPKHGLLPRWQRQQRLARRVQREDALRYLVVLANAGERATLQGLAGALQLNTEQAARLLDDLVEKGLVSLQQGAPQLTPDGRAYGLHMVRAHRLWEHYLAEKSGFTPPEWHQQADRREHSLSAEELEALAWELGNPTHDPHGDPIPTAGGRLVGHGGRPLTACASGGPLRIVHLEDEPDTVYAQLVAEGLRPGMQIHPIEVGNKRVRFWAGGDEHLLAPVVAQNISVVPIRPEEEQPATAYHTLADLRPGESARVTTLARNCPAAERRRLMDLGLIPGTLVKAEFVSPSGAPTAYRVRGALIGLRPEQAGLIRVQAPDKNGQEENGQHGADTQLERVWESQVEDENA